MYAIVPQKCQEKLTPSVASRLQRVVHSLRLILVLMQQPLWVQYLASYRSNNGLWLAAPTPRELLVLHRLVNRLAVVIATWRGATF